MSTVMPEGKRVRDALHWISEQGSESGDQQKLVREAVFHFNLTPKEEAYLQHLFANRTDEEA